MCDSITENKCFAMSNQDWDIASLGCADDVKESIFRNIGTCGSGGVGDLHGIGFEFTSLGYNKVVSAM